MQTASKQFLEELERTCDARRQEILSAEDALEITGKTYYVSNRGNDEADGLKVYYPRRR